MMVAPSESCLSDLVFDDIIAGQRDLDPHLESCDRCAQRLAVLRESNEANEAIVRLMAAKVPARKSKPKWWLGLAAAGALAAGLVPILMLPSTPNDSIKGAGASQSHIEFYVKRDGGVRKGNSGDRFVAGDALRFSVSSETGGWLLLAGVDKTGVLSVYHPYNGERSAAQRPGIDLMLPDSLVLDDSGATEYFVAVFTDEPMLVETLRAAVRRAVTINEDSLRRLALPSDPTVHVITIDRK